MARLPYWLLHGAVHLDSDPLHARVYWDQSLANKDYIRDAFNPRSDVIEIGPRSWVFSDPSGNGSGPGWSLVVSGNPTSFLFPGYSEAQLGSHSVALYNPVNQVIVGVRNLGAWTTEVTSSPYARLLHLHPFWSHPELGGAYQHPYNAIAMYMAGQINWPVMSWVCALIDGDLYDINSTSIKYVNTIFDIPFAAIVGAAHVPGCFVDQMGFGLSSPTMITGVPAGKRVTGYACYSEATGEIVRMQRFIGGDLNTSGSSPVWVSPMRMVFG